MSRRSPRESPFPHTDGRRRGYAPHEVDAYLSRVKQTYEGDPSLDEPVSAAEIRSRGFTLTRRGYDPRYVDAALDRLEEVFFERERREFQAAQGLEAWTKYLSRLKKDIVGRMRRERGERFKRTTIFASGYRVSQVDAVVDQLAKHFDTDTEIRVNDVRTVRFFPQRRGYSEAQVDAYLDAVIEYLLAQR